LIVELGGKPAFPCNVSINEVAAHYSPDINDELTIPENAVVKVDVGVHINGYIADTAITVDLSDKQELLLEAAKEALEEAIRNVKPGTSLYVIGASIERTIKKYGFKPVKNLTGHSIDKYKLHAGISIPNYADRFAVKKLKKDMVLAIEPFATNGRGLTREGKITTIYSMVKRKSQLPGKIAKFYIAIQERFHGLPFSPRWLLDLGSPEEVKHAIRYLEKQRVLHGYPILIEVGHGLVSQFEHTVIVSDGDPIVTTR
ncbi:MAG: type II methionyl aminopeptidase, partial [Desulfurococcales archaeon]|nr:type II methionyl aminopeptidase [Desulfurococcales archaeon]